MKLVWHIFKKDLRRLALPLVLWSAVIVMQQVAWWFVRAGEGVRDRRSAVWLLLPVGLPLFLWGLHLVVAWLLVPQLIHDDPLIGDRAGWRVRPISGARLLAAKLFGAGAMFCLWPSLLTITWWLELGFGPGEIARVVAVNTLGMAVFTGVALTVAVLTDNFARFVAWSIVLLVAAGVAGLFLVAGMPANGEGPVSAAVLIARAALAGGVVLATAAVVVPLQFLRRQTALARGVAAAAALAAAFIVQAWPWSTAQLLAKTGWKNFALPTVSARTGDATLVVPPAPDRQPASVQVVTSFDLKGLQPGDLPRWSAVEPKWRTGDRRGPVLPIRLNYWASRRAAAITVARGDTAPRDSTEGAAWQMPLSGKLVPQLRHGQAAFSARYDGAIWRAARGPSVLVRAGAGAARGLTQVHVNSIGLATRYPGERERRAVRWTQAEPLFTPTAILGLLNADGMARHRFTAALATNGPRAFLDEWPDDNHWAHQNALPAGRTPIGLVAVTMWSSSFDQPWWRNDEDAASGSAPIPLEGAVLTSVTFEEAAPLEVALAETPFVPSLIVEGRLDDALRRAKAEDKLVLVRVPRARETSDPQVIAGRWHWPQLRELLVARFVCVQVGPEEAGRFRRQPADEDSTLLVVLKADGAELDRLWDLAPANLLAALNARLEGKNYAAVLMAELAARGGDDRQLRFQLHEALRARGELAGALEVILWLVDHPDVPAEGTEMFAMGARLQRFVANYGPARTTLLERRERAVANLRQDPRDVGAARRLFAITLGLRHDDAAWRDAPRIMPHENPLWWEFTRNWVGLTVGEKRYREAVAAVELEKFFAEGPAWVRAQLLQKRPLTPGGPPATVGDWQRQLVRTGAQCVEALAGAGQADAALRLAFAVLRINGSAETRFMLASVLQRTGAQAQARRLLNEKTYAP